MNGWKDYETWNVSLWIQNTECLYRLALECAGFQEFKNVMKNDVGSFVTDDGVAVPRELEALIFNEHLTYGKQEGSGLGLYVVKRVAELHGGSVRYERSCDKTHFTITMPLNFGVFRCQ